MQLNYYRPQTKFAKVMFYTCLSAHRGWYPSMPCRWYPSMPCRSLGGDGIPACFAWGGGSPSPYSGGSWGDCQGEDLQVHTWGISRPTLRGISRPTPGGVSRPTPEGVGGWVCIPLRQTPPREQLLLRVVRILLECIFHAFLCNVDVTILTRTYTLITVLMISVLVARNCVLLLWYEQDDCIIQFGSFDESRVKNESNTHLWQIFQQFLKLSSYPGPR